MNDIPDLNSALAKLDRALCGLNLRYALIGGAAVVLRGYDRATQDIDAVVLDADDRLDELFVTLRAEGLVPRKASPIEFARRFRMVLVDASDGTGVDISMGFLPFEVEIVERATFETVGSFLTVPIATAEDLIVMKLIASRPRDIEDVLNLVGLYPEINRERVRHIVREFAEVMESSEILENLERLIC